MKMKKILICLFNIIITVTSNNDDRFLKHYFDNAEENGGPLLPKLYQEYRSKKSFGQIAEELQSFQNKRREETDSIERAIEEYKEYFPLTGLE